MKQYTTKDGAILEVDVVRRKTDNVAVISLKREGKDVTLPDMEHRLEFKDYKAIMDLMPEAQALNFCEQAEKMIDLLGMPRVKRRRT